MPESFSDSKQPVKITGPTGIQICKIVMDECKDNFYFATMSQNGTVHGGIGIDGVYMKIKITDKLCHSFDSETYVCNKWNGNRSDFIKVSKEETKEPERISPDMVQSDESLQKDNAYGQECLIATASFGSDMSPQVQMLREIRDNIALNTYSGSLFMNSFNIFYYLLSPTVAQWENENPVFKEVVKTFITPMVYTLSIMTVVDEGSDAQVVTLGILTIGLIVGMYVVAPITLVWKIKKMKTRTI